MTVTSSVDTNTITHIGNAGATNFSFPFSISSKDELLVIITDVSGIGREIETDDFRLNGLDNLGFLEEGEGSIDFPIDGSDPIPATSTITITTRVRYDQPSIYRNQIDLDLPSLEGSLDRIVRQTRELNRQFGKSIRYNEGNDITEARIFGNPEPGKFLTVRDNEGNLDLVNSLDSSFVPSAFGESILGLSDANQLRSVLNVITLGDLGSAAILDVGTDENDIPTLGPGGVLSSSVIPQQSIPLSFMEPARISIDSANPTNTINIRAGQARVRFPNGSGLEIVNVSNVSIALNNANDRDDDTTSSINNDSSYAIWVFLLDDGTVTVKFSES